MTEYYVHYDHDTGQITGFTQSNESGLALEITHDEYVAFVSGEKRMHEYIVSYGENSEGEDVLMLLFNVRTRQTVNNLRLRWVSKSVTDTTALVIKWDLENKHWRFLLTESGKNTPSVSTIPSVFYIVDRDNIDYLLRAITVEYDQIANGDEFVVPFETDQEQDLQQLMIAAKSRFKNFGLEEV